MTTHEHNQPDNSEGNFGLPEGYFQKSAESILNKIEWQEEHKEFAKLLELRDQRGFIIPDAYFENAEYKLELLDFSTLTAIQKTNPFVIPENYFEAAELSLLSAGLIEPADELQSFKTLNSVRKQVSFQTGNNYFSTGEKRITGFLLPQKQAKYRTLFSAKLWYAAAAMLMITLGVWIYANYNKPVDPDDCGTIACLDQTDLIQTKTLETLENEELYELVNSKKLEEHLNSGTIKKTEDLKSDSDSKENAIQDLPEGILK